MTLMLKSSKLLPMEAGTDVTPHGPVQVLRAVQTRASQEVGYSIMHPSAAHPK